MPAFLNLEDVAQDYETELAYPEDERDESTIETIESFMSEIGADDLDTLKSMAQDDPGLIADWYFKDYAQDLAESIGAIDPDAGWPVYHIDWDEAADSLKMDYTSVDYGGETYWMGNY